MIPVEDDLLVDIEDSWAGGVTDDGLVVGTVAKPGGGLEAFVWQYVEDGPNPASMLNQWCEGALESRLEDVDEPALVAGTTYYAVGSVVLDDGGGERAVTTTLSDGGLGDSDGNATGILGCDVRDYSQDFPGLKWSRLQAIDRGVWGGVYEVDHPQLGPVHRAFVADSDKAVDVHESIQASLGITLTGSQVVDVATRPETVYVGIDVTTVDDERCIRLTLDRSSLMTLEVLDVRQVEYDQTQEDVASCYVGGVNTAGWMTLHYTTLGAPGLVQGAIRGIDDGRFGGQGPFYVPLGAGLVSSDIDDGLNMVLGGGDGDNEILGATTGLTVQGVAVDEDEDGLFDWYEEHVVFTDPTVADLDNDGMLDGTELDVAQGRDCPDPHNPDSDGDTLLDGQEVDLGTDPCNPDTDDDGLADNLDPDPLTPGEFGDLLAELISGTCDDIGSVDVSLFTGPNANANRGRRNAGTNHCRAAVNETEDGEFGSAIDALESLEGQLSRWMAETDVRTDLFDEIDQWIALLEGRLG